MPPLNYSPQEVRLGALYRMGAAHGFDRETLVRLMVSRAQMKPACAVVLAGHWLTSLPFRTPRIPPCPVPAP